MFKQAVSWVSVACLCALPACATQSDGDDGVAEASSALTACWPVVGLYYAPCNQDASNIRDRIPQGAQIDLVNPLASRCPDGTYWVESVFHANGHHGWIRSEAICP